MATLRLARPATAALASTLLALAAAGDPPATQGRRVPPQPLPQPVAGQASDGGRMDDAAVARATSAAPTDRGLRPVRTIARPGGPVELAVTAPERSGALTVLVLDRTGTPLDTLSVTPGVMDALALCPVLAQAQQTLWLQLAEDGTPVGTPVWVTPLRSPPPARTVRSVRASNQQPYLRVVGWGDRAFDPADPETAAAMPTWSAPDPVVTAGFRVESATDAVLETGEGPIRVALAPDAAPATVDNFLRLARAGFYDGTLFHRVVPADREGRPFVVQGGDPTGTGDGGPGWNLALEPSDLPHDRGVLGMARGDDPHSAGSQFYIGLSREGTARLDRQYCTFGVMLDGFDALDRIARSEIGDQATGRPTHPPVLQRVRLVPSAACVPGRDPHGRAPTPPPPPAPAAISPSSPAPTPER